MLVPSPLSWRSAIFFGPKSWLTLLVHLHRTIVVFWPPWRPLCSQQVASSLLIPRRRSLLEWSNWKFTYSSLRCGRPKCKTLLEASTRLTCKHLIIIVSTTACTSCLVWPCECFLAVFVLSALAQESRFWWPSGSGTVRIKALSHRAPLVWVLAWC